MLRENNKKEGIKKFFGWKKNKRKRKPVKIVPFGGLNEVGKNMMVFEQGNDIIIIDMGFEFPSDNLMGVNYIIPDTSYLEKNKHKIKAIIITHGHLDHIGGIKYIINKIGNPPVYANKITRGFIENQVGKNRCKINTVKVEDKLRFGGFMVEFFDVNHSIPNPFGVIIKSSEGTFVHTGDFKFDHNPTIGKVADFEKIGSLSKKDVTLLFSDSTNALKDGHTISEKVIGENLDKLIAAAKGRIIIATFSSLIGRIQDIFNSAKKHNKRVYISGRSMENNVDMATRLGCLNYPKNLVHKIERSKHMVDQNALIISTGAQGEEMASLNKMAEGSHKYIQIKESDTVIISSSPIPGNERAFFTIVNKLSKLGAKIVNHRDMDIHTSGHGQKEELSLMLELVKSKYFAPIHGEWFMRKAHKEIAESVGYKKENCIMIENGNVLEVEKGVVKVLKDTISTDYILIDGKREGRMNSNVIRDRNDMSKNGVLVIMLKVNQEHTQLISKPIIETKGLIYEHDREVNEKFILKKIDALIKKNFVNNKKISENQISPYLKSNLTRCLIKEIGKSPVIITKVI